MKTKQASIHLQKRGFAISLPIGRKRIDYDALVDVLIELPGVSEVDGPVANGAIGVTYDDDDRPDAVLLAELQQACAAFLV